MRREKSKTQVESSNPIVRFVKENSGIIIALMALCIILSIMVPDKFLTYNNFTTVLRSISTTAIMAFGMTFVIITGGIDLSVGSIVALSGTLCAGLISSSWNYAAAVIIGLAVGTLCGAFNGFVISRTEIPPFIVTMGMMNIARGASYIYSSGKPIRTPDDFGSFGNGYFLSIPIPVIVKTVLMILSILLLSKSKFGRSVYAIGGNKEAARFSGINIKNVIWLVYVLIGFLASAAGIITASRLYSGQPTVAQGIEMDVIAATVLGGVSMAGGVGKIGGTMIGAIIIGVLSTGMNLLKIPSFYQMIVMGIVILLAVYLDVRRKK
ncbi:ABC transporter permease [Lachnospiraceae bacterium 42-17]|jgi:ribose transport system permease protein|nr:ABC transporter permease [Dorea sp.]